jgi:hypothetical protein
MICPNSNCKKFVSPFEDICQHCGASLKKSSIKDYAKKADEMMGKVDVSPEVTDAGLQSLSIEKSFYELRSSSIIPDFIKTDITKLMHGVQLEFAEPHLDEEQEVKKALLTINNLCTSVRTYKVMILIKDSLFGHLCLTENEDYYRRFKITDFSHQGLDFKVVDASASYDQQTNRYKVNLSDGYINFIIALEWFFKLRQFNNGKEEQSILKRILYYIVESDGVSTDCLIRTLIQHYKINDKHLDFLYHIFRIMEKAFISISLTVAHEMGHIYLGHFRDENVFVHQNFSTNQESEADSFASSIVTSILPESFKEELVLANMKREFAWVLLDICSSVSGKRQPATHPHSMERLKNVIRANPKIVKDHSIDEVWIDYILRFQWLKEVSD